MKYKKIFRVISLFLAVFMLVISVPAMVYAADASDVSGIEESGVVDDLVKMGFDTTKYKLDSSADYVTVIDFLEYGYDYYGDTSRYGLYLYLYNPSGKVLDVYSSRNKASLQCVVNKVGIGFSNYRLVYLNSTEDNLLYKFKINVPQNFMLKPSKAERCYEIGDIELKYEDENHKSFGAGGSWIYRGYQAYCGVDRASNISTLSYKAEELITLKLDLHSVTWLSDSSTVGYDFKYEVFGAYFSVPDYIIEKYGDKNDVTKGLVSIDGVYQRYTIDGIITKNYTFYETALKYAGKDCTLYDVPFGFRTNNQATVIHLDRFSYNTQPFLQLLASDEDNRKLSSYDTAFCLTVEEIENQSKFSDVCTRYLRDYVSNIPDYNKEYTKYSVKAESGDMARQILTFSNGHKNNFWHWVIGRSYLFDEEHDVSYENLYPIISLSTSDVDYITSGKETVSAALYVDESYLQELKSYVDSSSSKKETTFLFRYDIEDYFCSPIKVAQKGAGNDMSIDYGNYFFQKTVYDGLDVLSLTWRDERGGMKIIPVAATSISNSGIITKPHEKDNIFEDLFGSGGKPKTPDFMIPVAIALGLVIVIAFYYLWNLWLSPRAIERITDHSHQRKVERDKAKINAKERSKANKKGDKK